MIQSIGNESGLLTAILSAIGLLMLMALALVLFFLLSRKKIVQKELEKKNLTLKHQEELLHATILAQEKERSRIARDLHDEVSSKLNVISLNIRLLQDKTLETEMFDEVSAGVVDITGKALENARRIAHNLLPPILESFGLEAAVEELFQEFNSVQNLDTNCIFNQPIDCFDKDDQIHVFRIIQELMNNSLRHGKAKTINLITEMSNDKIHFEYTDDGKGFDSDDESVGKGLGMKNIESRMLFLDGSYKLYSKPGKGVKFDLYFDKK